METNLYWWRTKKMGLTHDEALQRPIRPCKSYTMKELSYISRFYEVDGRNNMADELGRTPKAVSKKYHEIRKAGMLDHYKQMWEAIG